MAAAVVPVLLLLLLLLEVGSAKVGQAVVIRVLGFSKTPPPKALQQRRRAAALRRNEYQPSIFYNLILRLIIVLHLIWEWNCLVDN